MNKRRAAGWSVFALGALTITLSSGCTSSTGSKYSVWPTQTLGSDTTAPSPTAGMTTALASTTQAVKGQFSSVGTAMTSAYSKAKTAITSPFSATDGLDSGIAVTDSTPTTPMSMTPEVYVMTGQLNESKGDFAKAIDSYSKALEADPRNLSALLSTARLYDRQNDREKAISFYNKAIDVHPSNAATYAELGNIYSKSGNLNAAKEQLAKAINLDPKNTSYRSTMAGVQLDMGAAEEALDELRQVNAPAMANYQMAYLHFARKNIPATQQYLTTALEIDPNLKPARDLLASIGGGQSIQNMAQQGNQWVGQAQGIMQQASAVSSNIQNLWPGDSAATVNGNASSLPATSVSSPAQSLPAPPNAFNAPSHSSVPLPTLPPMQ